MTYCHFGASALLLLSLVGVLRHKTRIGRACLVFGVVGLFLWTLPLSSMLLSRFLESPYRARPVNPDAAVEVIVVLGGGVDERTRSLPEDLPNRATFLRCRYAAWLYRNGLTRPVLVSGGVPADGGAQPLARIMARTLEEVGVPRPMIWTEEASRSTYENATCSARILRGKSVRRIALVTEAYHMRRAEACFRKQGFDVAPVPVAFRGGGSTPLPSAASMAQNENVLHELLGLAWYRLRGRI